MLKIFRDDRGASAISYALIAGIVSLGIVAGLTTLVGSSLTPSGLNGIFTKAGKCPAYVSQGMPVQFVLDCQ